MLRNNPCSSYSRHNELLALASAFSRTHLPMEPRLQALPYNSDELRTYLRRSSDLKAGRFHNHEQQRRSCHDHHTNDPHQPTNQPTNQPGLISARQLAFDTHKTRCDTTARYTGFRPIWISVARNDIHFSCVCDSVSVCI